ncbi:MAG: hypothetical protein JOY83_13475 [Alphaproteobacteria bacterium]|nr:hypothetical protein [Alphaproteobacteria bacterium]
MLKLTITVLAGVAAFAYVPAFAVDLPDYGSKNFSPSGDTPSYFANESAPVSARTADTTERDWSVVDEMAPARRYESARSVHSRGGRHGRYTIAGRSARPGASRSGGNSHWAHTVSWGGRSAAKTTSGRHKPSARHASAGAHSIMN